MLYFDHIDYREWADKHNIEIIDCTCPSCGKEMQTTVPCISQRSYGLASPLHECGHQKRIHVLTPRDLKIRKSMSESFKAVISALT